MINHNSNIIESQFGNAGSGSLFLENALVYLLDSDYPGSGSWHNRVGNAITVSGSFVNSGSAGFGFNASARLNLEDSVAGVTFNPFVRDKGITFIFEAQLGSYANATTPVLTINSLDGQIFSVPGGYDGTALEYRQSGSVTNTSVMSMKNSFQGQGDDVPDFVSSSVNIFALTVPSGSGDAFLYFNNDVRTTTSPFGGASFGYYENNNPVVFGNFPDQVITVPPSFFTDWQRYRGTLKTLLVYNRALNDTQIRKVINNLQRGV
jgi:hypothetical protein